jgi:hypothetical protein
MIDGAFDIRGRRAAPSRPGVTFRSTGTSIPPSQENSCKGGDHRNRKEETITWRQRRDPIPKRSP